MSLSTSLSSRPDWYRPGDDDPTLDPAREAFRLAVDKFGADLTRDARKRDRVNQALSITELQKVVTEAQTKYATKHEDSGTRKWLVRLFKKISHYGTILDVLVQHHPEYVALAWGAMKFLFTAVLNHEALLSCIAKGLAQIADTLPGVEVAAVLFPTEPMKRALAEIYAHIIRFLIRAHDWFSEGKLLRALHSVTRPKELRYDDLLDDIKTSTASFRNLAITASQAEQRDMHILLLEVKQMMTSYQQINASAMLNTNMALTDLQFSNILNALTNLPLEDPDKSLQRATFLSARARNQRMVPCDPFWLHPRFQAWAESPASGLVMVRGSHSTRAAMKDCLVNAIEQIRRSNATALWALKTQVPNANPNSDTQTTNSITAVELLKYLTSQALKFGPPPTERSLTISCARFQRARDEREWIDLLAVSLADLKHVYIVVDVELLLSPEPSSSSIPFTLPESFTNLFAQLGQASPNTTVKVMLASYGSPLLAAVAGNNSGDVITAGRGGRGGKSRPPQQRQRNNASRYARGSSIIIPAGRGRPGR